MCIGSARVEKLSVAIPSSSRSRVTKQLRLERFFEPKHPSSDEFDPGVEVSRILEDNVIEDTIMYDVNNQGNVSYPQSVEDSDTFQTVASTPRKVNRSGLSDSFGGNNDNLSNSELFYFKRPDLVPLSYQGQNGKKRSSAESMRPPLSKKIILGINESQSPMFYHVNHLSPTEAPKLEAPKPGAIKDPSLANKAVPISLQEEARNVPHELRWSKSFESNTSSSTTATPNQIWTPNNSFPVESAATSFNSSADTADVSDSFLCNTLPQSHTFGDTAMRLATETSRFEMGNATLNKDWNATANAEVKESVIVASNDRKASSRNPKEYLVGQIFPSTLLSKFFVLISWSR